MVLALLDESDLCLSDGAVEEIVDNVSNSMLFSIKLKQHTFPVFGTNCFPSFLTDIQSSRLEWRRQDRPQGVGGIRQEEPSIAEEHVATLSPVSTHISLTSHSDSSIEFSVLLVLGLFNIV